VNTAVFFRFCFFFLKFVSGFSPQRQFTYGKRIPSSVTAFFTLVPPPLLITHNVRLPSTVSRVRFRISLLFLKSHTATRFVGETSAGYSSLRTLDLSDVSSCTSLMQYNPVPPILTFVSHGTERNCHQVVLFGRSSVPTTRPSPRRLSTFLPSTLTDAKSPLRGPCSVSGMSLTSSPPLLPRFPCSKAGQQTGHPRERPTSLCSEGKTYVAHQRLQPSGELPYLERVPLTPPICFVLFSPTFCS